MFACVQAAMQRFGSQVTDKHVWEMIDEADLDGDSQINYDEFVRIMGGTSSQPNAFVTKMASSKRQQPQSAAPVRYPRAEPAMAAVVAVAAEMGARSRAASASGSGLQLPWKAELMPISLIEKSLSSFTTTQVCYRLCR